MIKYVELTAPEASAYRQAKILSIECNEGDQIKTGDTLFVVQSGNTKLELPSTKDGRIIEFIVSEQESITLSTALLLLETEVESSTATPPLQQDSEAKAVNQQPQSIKNSAPNLEQQSLDLSAGELDQTVEEPKTAAPQPVQAPPVNVEVAHQETSEINSMSDSTSITINVPDIGADSAKVIEILVNVGDNVTAEDPLVTLESDKASMDVPSPQSGVVKAISVSLDQDVSEGTALIELESSDSSADETKPESKSQESDASEVEEPQTSTEPTAAVDASSSETIAVTIPDIGGDAAKVVDILVAVGDEVDIEDALVTLESDKASMDVPSSAVGVVKSIEVNIDDDVSEGSIVVTLTASGTSATESNTPVAQPSATSPAAEKTSAPTVATAAPSSAPVADKATAPAGSNNDTSHASPSIRRFARELGVDLAKVQGSGRKNRITKDDVKSFVKGALNTTSNVSAANQSDHSGIPPVPAQDFTKFGDIELAPLNKIKRLTAANLHRSWLNVPHVTHNDESNINDLEEFRKQLNTEYKAQNKGIKLSPLAFIVKAVVNALQAYPQFNSSLEPGGENLILKKYFHIGIAVETPNGLVVPVIRDADTKSVAQIATEMGELASKAREKKLTMNDMTGASFTISSLGGIGGTSFTPIVNAPEVAILGVSRSKVQPVWNGTEFIPGMMLPLSLSYDHRVIDGAEAARFTRHVAAVLEDVRRLTV